ncbi:MAG: Sec-independent protein translocase protein TatB [Pseudomonadota bacterium]
MNLLPGIGFFEIVVVAVVALIVVGPKDLPRLMRLAGRAVAQAKRMASEFTSAFNQMAREGEMEEMRKEIDALKRNNVISETRRSIEDAVRPVEKSVRSEVADINRAGAGSVTERAE